MTAVRHKKIWNYTFHLGIVYMDKRGRPFPFRSVWEGDIQVISYHFYSKFVTWGFAINYFCCCWLHVTAVRLHRSLNIIPLLPFACNQVELLYNICVNRSYSMFVITLVHPRKTWSVPPGQVAILIIAFANRHRCQHGLVSNRELPNQDSSSMFQRNIFIMMSIISMIPW